MFVRRQVVQDPLRIERIVALGRLGAHDVTVTSRDGTAGDTPGGRPARVRR